MKYMTQSIASTTWVALNRSRILYLTNSLLLISRHRLVSGHRRPPAPIAPAVARLPAPLYVLTTFRCPGEFDVGRSSSAAIAASTPPARCGTPAAASPISTPDKAPTRVSALHSPR